MTETAKPSLLELSELEDDLVPEILPSSASMSVKAPAAKLRALFARASSVSPQKEVVPGTAHALLEAKPTTPDHVAHLKITASDGEQTVVVTVDGVDVRVPGKVLLTPKRVSDILRLAPTDAVDISVVGTTALIRSGRARWSLQVPVGEVPDLSRGADLTGATSTMVNSSAFRTALRAARLAAATSARAALMQLRVKDGSIIACDGGRLHKAIVPGLDPRMDTTIPVRVADELIKALDGAEGPLTFGYTESHLVFEVGDDWIVAQKMLLAFPDLSQLLLNAEVTGTMRLIVDKAELEEAVKRVRVNADPDVAVVTLSTVPGGRSADDWALEVKARDRAGNTALEVVECQWDGKPKEVTYNHHHLTDALSVCTASTLILRLGGDTKSSRTPVLIADPDAGVTCVVTQVTHHL